ncbi:chromosome partitioning protein ParB [Dechloromonas sp. TW-R-39-2]|uniref:plasmid partitioning protein RepB C-terminal domain-containing protein n=1 Tax=Dechloromonas sp. TW-R-39-2 TaxID=2654218 RepID=UPI00193E49D7|nr:plasmid partitioning protein RepB C-terminal domain-containing protein [Dechloromonas sp. TW-R-39-2]QRM18985.1 chromosome partitioning protein ParB [Dechloromonas sp. TW-R-39-2]
MNGVPRAFSPEILQVPLDKLLPSRSLPSSVPGSVKFRQIVSSIQSVGLIEPLSISPMDAISGQYLVLDGHVRLMAMQELEFSVAPCLLAADDEAYTYNSRINRLSSIQETRMLQEAVAKGVSKDRLAQSLNIDISSLLKKLKLLDGICPEAVELLRDLQFSPEISRILRKMKATRQVVCVDLMLSANSLTVNYAEALLATTPAELLVGGEKPEMKGVTAEQMARMEHEMENLQGQYKLIEDSYADDVLNLVVAQGYLSKLLANDAVSRFIEQHRQDIYEQFKSIALMNSLDS